MYVQGVRVEDKTKKEGYSLNMIYTFDFPLKKHVKQDSIKEKITDIVKVSDGTFNDFVVGKSKDGKRIARLKIDFDALYKTVIFLAKVYAKLMDYINIIETKTNARTYSLTNLDRENLNYYTSGVKRKVDSLNRQLDAEVERSFSTGKDSNSNTHNEYKKANNEFYALSNFNKVYPNV